MVTLIHMHHIMQSYMNLLEKLHNFYPNFIISICPLACCFANMLPKLSLLYHGSTDIIH